MDNSNPIQQPPAISNLFQKPPARWQNHSLFKGMSADSASNSATENSNSVNANANANANNSGRENPTPKKKMATTTRKDPHEINHHAWIEKLIDMSVE